MPDRPMDALDISYLRMTLKDSRDLITQLQGHNNVSIELMQLDKSIELLKQYEHGDLDKPVGSRKYRRK